MFVLVGFITAVLSGLLVGSLSGLVGIGGGVLLVPLLLYVFRLDMNLAAGTSLAIVIPTAIVGSLVHFGKGNVDWRLTVVIALGSILGAVIGAWGGSHLPGETLKKIFAVILVLISLKVAFDAFTAQPATGIGSPRTAHAGNAITATNR
jgi:uncharacterized membrane protein YfcA